MAKFRYRMQNILDVKLKLEEQAKADFAFAARRVAEEEEKLQNLQIQRAEYERALREASIGRIDLNNISFYKSAINTMKTKIRTQMMQVHTAQRNLEARRKQLNDVMADRKMHENLKEKEFEMFKEELAKDESKAIDELVSFTYGEKQSGVD